MNKRFVAILQLILTGIMWSLGGLFIKLIDIHPFAIVSLRSLIASLVIVSFLKFKPKFIFTKAQILGGLCYVATVCLFVTANKTTTSANAILLQYSAPIYASFMGYFILGEKLKWFDFIALIGITIGMIIFFADTVSGGLLLGNVLAILSGVTFAGQAVCLRLQKNESLIETILIGNILAAIIGMPFVFFSPPSMSNIWALLFLGIFQLGIPYILYPLAAKNASSLDLVVIPMIEPILNPVWVFLGTGEKPTIFSVVGGIIVIVVVGFKSYWTIKVANNNAV